MRIGIYQRYWGRVGGGQRYLGVVAEVLSRKHDVEIVHHDQGFEPTSIGHAMDVDLSGVRFRWAPAEERPAWPTRNPLARRRMERDWQRNISAGYDLFLDSSDVPPYFCHAKRGVLLVHFPLVSRDEFHGRSNGVWSKQSWLVRAAKSSWQDWEWKSRVGTYDLCLANSEFTQNWILKRWGLESQVVNPPLRNGLTAGPKDNTILTIGAFHHARHKKHEVLIDAFRTMCDAGLQGWRYLIVGACGKSAEDRDYLAELKQLAANYPIELRTDVASDELRRLLGQASMLWHSMGYGVDVQREPQRMEHFGMVVTEAMAAGCVPLVFNGGGLPEIVTHDVDGKLWTDVEQLCRGTLELARAPDRLERLAAGAQRRAEYFNTQSFESRLLGALAPVLK